MEARGLSQNTIRARLSAVAVISGAKVQLPKRIRISLVLSEDQLQAFFRQICTPADRELIAAILLTGHRPKPDYHWLAITKPGRTTQEITRKIKRYARLAGLDPAQVNMRTLIRTGLILISKYSAAYIAETLMPRPVEQVVAWKPLHGIGRRSRSMKI
jgi:hypothetical protein